MRKVIYSVASSLDGFIAGPDGDFGWIPEEPSIDWEAFKQRFDTVLVGRRTYETTLDGRRAALPEKTRCYVFSRTLSPAEHVGVKIVSDDATRVVEELRREEGKAIWLMGGGMLFASLLEAQLVDHVEVGLVPILLGQGLPLLHPLPRRTRLSLTRTQKWSSGIVLLNYEVTPARQVTK